MNPETRPCPKCDGQMVQGFTVDMGTGDFTLGSRHVSKWAPGAPVKSLLFKTWVPANSLPIGTYRCSSCGYLESYANSEFGSKRRYSLRDLFVAFTVIAVLLAIVGAIIRLAN